MELQKQREYQHKKEWNKKLVKGYYCAGWIWCLLLSISFFFTIYNNEVILRFNNTIGMIALILIPTSIFCCLGLRRSKTKVTEKKKKRDNARKV